MEVLGLFTYLTVLGVVLPDSQNGWSPREIRSGMNVTRSNGIHKRGDRDKAVSQSGRQTNGSDWKAVSQSGRQTNGSDWKAVSQSGRQTNGSDWKADSRSRRQTNWDYWKADTFTSVNQTSDQHHQSEDGDESALYTWKKGKQTAEEFLHNYCSQACVLEHSNINTAGSEAIISPDQMNSISILIKPTSLSCGAISCFSCYCIEAASGGKLRTAEPDIMYDYFYDNMTLEPERPVEDSVFETPTASGTVSDGKETEQKMDRDCVMGNCCPTRPPLDLRPDDLTIGQYTGCLAGQEQRFLSVVRCPEQHPDPTLRQECEHGKGNFTIDEPVTDLATQVVYRNPHCAKCHGVDGYTPWRLQIECQHFQYLYTVRSELELLEEVSDVDTNRHIECTLNHVHPPYSSPKDCGPLFPKYSPLIRTCNVTGRWTKLDEDVQTNCAKFTALHFRVREIWPTMSMFMNLFCALCNGVQIKTELCNRLKDIEQPPPGPLTFLMGLQDRQETAAVTVDTCPAGQWLSLDVSITLLWLPEHVEGFRPE